MSVQTIGYIETKLYNLLRSLHDCDNIKFAAYRTSSKLRLLQKAFSFDKLTVDLVGGVFNQHRLTSTENSLCLTTPEIEALIEDILFVVSKQENVECEETSQLLTLFLDRLLKKAPGIEVISLKVVLTIITGSRPKDKYKYLFDQLSDHNNVLTSRKLELLLQRLILLPAFFGEGNSFGKALVPGSVESCFPDSATLGVTFEEFIQWLGKDPQLLVWVSTLYRLQISSSVIHEVKCSVCKQAPIKGLRYRCLKCLSHNQCQECFFAGLASGRHKLTHLVQEYCAPSTTKQSTLAFLTTLKNRMKNAGWKMQYLPAEHHESYLKEKTLKLKDIEESPFEAIIHDLETQISSIYKEMDRLQPKEIKKLLEKHRSQIELQIKQLKAIKGDLKTKALTFSTPCSRFKRNCSTVSPILESQTLSWDKEDLLSVNLTNYEEQSCVLTSQTLDNCPSSGYTWLQPSVPEEKMENIKHLEDDLDAILNKLQEFLNKNSEPDDALEILTPVENYLEHIL